MQEAWVNDSEAGRSRVAERGGWGLGFKYTSTKRCYDPPRECNQCLLLEVRVGGKVSLARVLSGLVLGCNPARVFTLT